MKEMYAVLSYDAEDGGLLGCELFNTIEEACRRLKHIVTTECWYPLREEENIKLIDDVVSKRDLSVNGNATDFNLCDDLGVEVGKDWTWARTFDSWSGYSCTESLFAVQRVDLPKGE